MKKATIKSGNRQQANNKPNERTVKAKEGKTGEAKTPEDDRWRCPQCGSSKLPHCACDNCGYVNPKLALAVETESA